MARPSTTNVPYLTIRSDTGKYAYVRTLSDDLVQTMSGTVELTWTTIRRVELGGRFIKISLQTGDLATARNRWSVVHSQIEAHIAKAVAVGRRSGDNAPLERRRELTPAELRALAGQTLHDMLAEDDSAWAEPDKAGPLPTIIAGILAGDPAAVDRPLLDTARKLALDVESRLTQRAIRERDPGLVADDLVVKIHAPPSDSLMAMSEPPELTVLASELSQRLTENGLTVEPGRGRNLAALNHLRAKEEALTALRRRARNEVGVPTPERPDLIRPLEQPPQETKPKLSEMLARWRKDAAPSPKNYDDRAIYVNRFISIYGDLPVDKVTKKQVVSFRDLHLEMPRNVPHSLRNAHPDQILAWAKTKPDVKLLSRRTINNKVVSGLSAIMAQAVHAAHCEHNPCAGTKLKIKPSQTVEKLPFSDAQLKKIFALPLFKPPHKLPKAAPGESGFWVPLISLLSGLRIEEICQLHLADVKKLGLVDYFDVTTLTTQEDDESADDEAKAKKLKSENSKREVPIHPRLIELGFLEYVAEQRDRKHVRIFPGLKPYRERFSKNLSRWWGRYQDKHISKSKHITFHSFRHSFTSAMRNAEIQETLMKGILGHSGGDVTSKYGLPHILEVRASAIAKIEYPSIDFSAIKHPSRR